MDHHAALMEALITTPAWELLTMHLKKNIAELERYILEGHYDTIDTYKRAVDKRKVLLDMYELPLKIAALSSREVTGPSSLDPYETVDESRERRTSV